MPNIVGYAKRRVLDDRTSQVCVLGAFPFAVPLALSLGVGEVCAYEEQLIISGKDVIWLSANRVVKSFAARLPVSAPRETHAS